MDGCSSSYASGLLSFLIVSLEQRLQSDLQQPLKSSTASCYKATRTKFSKTQTLKQLLCKRLFSKKSEHLWENANVDLYGSDWYNARRTYISLGPPLCHTE